MAENYGVKIAKEGFDVKTFLTEINKKNFNILSTEDCLLRKELSSTSSNDNMFLGYALVTVRDGDPVDEARPVNYEEDDDTFTVVYVNYENAMPS